MSLQQTCYQILSPYREAKAYQRTSKLFDIVLIVLILINIVGMMLETVPTLSPIWRYELHLIEQVSVLLFTIEYILRVWSAASAPDKHNTSLTPWQKRIAYLKSPMAIIDLVAILPFYLGNILFVDLRILRIFRVLRILKLGRYSRSMQTLLTVIKNESHSLLAALSILLVFTVIAATCIYYIEHSAQPEAFSSIPASLWWALVTLTTVGYGDVVPITTLGKIFGGLITMLGICFYALPAGILSSSFIAQIQLRRDRFKYTVSSILADGKLSKHEAAHIDKMRELLDLDEEEARMIIRLLQHHHHTDSDLK